ncbi:MAG TPA: CpsD/CapB family tyrosine-protein kinase [Vicinamibacterales bacterium]
MGRIDDALRRATGADGSSSTLVSVPPPAAADNGDATEVFSSPWAFGEGEEEAPAAAAPTAPVPAAKEPVSGDLSVPSGGGRLALFRGFKREIIGRIVAGAGAPPVLAEQFRRLAATLHHAQLVQGTKVVMVTSANSGDGKSLTATNLALTLSESYRREVLLIDADLRRPSLHDMFQVPNVGGLNDGLQAPQDGRLQVIKITDTLTLLPAGRPNPDPMSSLASARMQEILREGAVRFDWVIIDTAPLGLLADANLLTTMVDGALLVIRANQTPHADVQRALESLGREKVLGVVLNAIEPSSKDMEYYGRTYLADDKTSLPAARPT